LRRGVQLAGDCIKDTTLRGFRVRPALVTFTYRDDVAWEARHITQVQNAIEKFLERRQVRYHAVWVMELTKRGRPHYHLVLWLPKGITLPKPDKRGWWVHGMTRIEWARRPVGYLIKYASKAEDAGAFPPGARLFGVRGLGDAREGYRYLRRPQWLREATLPADRLQRVARVGWLNQSNGEILRSPWVIVARGRCWSWVTVRRVDGVEDESSCGQSRGGGGTDASPGLDDDPGHGVDQLGGLQEDRCW
jgi:hypothetical protein